MNKVGRNDPCPCGSGKKYKHCHQLSEQGGVAPSVVQAFALPAGRESQLVSQGNALQSQGRLEEAAGCYRQAIAINPGAAELHSNLGNL
ncbi:MAG: SEC-C metal-binding domain-containing protein, partial [Proteobacteria bacterium]|nr:SEC-C metal-binding domain-containing protein [Pseudomonadota bacterium]